jgi:methionyl aminopeptidase
LAPDVLEKLREAGRIAAAARDHGATLIVAGASVRDVCEAVEDAIRARGAWPAFPTQSSRNHLAAHYCPSPEDSTVYAVGDLAKLDVGVHIDGYVVDTALTVNVGDEPQSRRLVAAARAALEAAIAVVTPGVEVRRLSLAIEKALKDFGARPMRNLCGHGVGRWTVHCPPPIPNAPEASRDCLEAGAVVAIEPFATEGRGLVAEQGEPEVFRLPPERTPRSGDPAVVEAIRGFRGLPFARRSLKALPRKDVEQTLRALHSEGSLAAYAPLAEASGRTVAQAEHTIYVGPSGVEVLTR